jgi:hypothetical protein
MALRSAANLSRVWQRSGDARRGDLARYHRDAPPAPGWKFYRCPIVDWNMIGPWKTVPTAWLVIPWFVLIGAGFIQLLHYGSSAGEDASTAPRSWPTRSRVNPNPGVFNLVLFAHPKCPCSRATIGELSILMAQCQAKVASHILFLRPLVFLEGWEQTNLWRAGEIIPGVEVLADPGGAEATLFRAATSGEVLLYDLNGQLVFEGGITASRGHAGDNPGRSAIVSLVTRGETGVRSSPVFGCSLRDPSPLDPSK